MTDVPLRVIRPERARGVLDLAELWAYRDLFYFMVWRDIKARYAQSVLGFGWAILRPVLSTLVFTGVFGIAAELSSDGVPYPLFAFTSTILWTYFSGAVGAAGASLVGNRMISKVYFPRLVVPTTPILSGLVDLAIAFVLLLAVVATYHFRSPSFQFVPTAHLLMLPVLVLIMMVFASGLGLLLASLAVQYRDVKFASSFIVSLLMYLAPVVWTTSLIAERFPEHADTIRLVYGLYPMAGVIEGFRAALLGSIAMPWDLIASGAASTVALWVIAALYFRRRERIFADVF